MVDAVWLLLLSACASAKTSNQAVAFCTAGNDVFFIYDDCVDLVQGVSIKTAPQWLTSTGEPIKYDVNFDAIF